MEKVALVVHRYGKEICGGAEYLAYLFANRLKNIYKIDVITSTAVDDSTWNNYYREGVSVEDDVTIYRFNVQTSRLWEREKALPSLLADKQHSYFEEIRTLIDIGPYCPSLFSYIRQNHTQYKALIFFTYYYYQTSICSVDIPNAILLPTAHDEINIKLNHYRKLFNDAHAFIFNTDEEKKLIERIIGCNVNVPNQIVGSGIHLPTEDEIQSYENKELRSQNYLVYVGRVSEGKGCDELVSYVQRYNAHNKRPIKLKLVGKLQLQLPADDPNIEYVGFVSDDEKNKYVYNSLALIQPSKHESLSLVVLEAMAMKVPVVVNAQCSVLLAHVKKSSAGFAFDDYKTFSTAADRLINRTQDITEIGELGRDYVKNNYSWNEIISKIRMVIDQLGYRPTTENRCECFQQKEIIPVVLASDNNYVKYLAVAIESIVKNSSKNYNYDLIVLSDGIEARKREVLISAYQRAENIRIIFVECKPRLDKYVYNFTNKQLSRATFMRFLAIDLLSEYEKIAYVDCDTVINADIADLYNIDIGENLIGGVIDPHIELMMKCDSNVYAHIKENVKRETPYFNAGVILMNLKQLRSSFSTDDLLSLAALRSWRWEDQDILNYISEGKTQLLDRSWNVIWVGDKAIQNLMELNVEYSKALSRPKIFHYAGGILPTKADVSTWSYFFWSVARRSAFYEDLLKEIGCERPIINNIFTTSGQGRKRKFLQKMKNSINKRKVKVGKFVRSFFKV